MKKLNNYSFKLIFVNENGSTQKEIENLTFDEILTYKPQLNNIDWCGDNNNFNLCYIDNKLQKTKGKKISGEFIIIRQGSTIVGCMTWETPYINLKDNNNNEYMWVSDTIERRGIFVKPGEKINLTAFVKENGHLYRVKVNKLQ